MDVLVRPVITEKSMKDAANGKYTFAVAKSATKQDIAKAVAGKFNVKVMGVSTITVKGGRQRVGKRRTEIALSAWKKAVVQVEKGQKIDLFDLGDNK